MDLKSEDDEAETKLDLEFRRILRIIKVYIPCIMNVDYLASYRMWLEKLSEVDLTEKQERNRYLIELCRQIQDGVLEKPFLQRPTSGPLHPLGLNMIANKVQIQQQSLFHATTSVKQGPAQNTTSKEVNRSHKPASTKKEGQSEQECENYLKELSKTKQPGKKEPQMVQDKVRGKTKESEIVVAQTPPTLEQEPSVSQKKRNQHSVFREIQKHVRNKRVLCDEPLKFPESPHQMYPEEEVEIPFANTRQYMRKQQRNIPANEYYLQMQMQQQNAPFYQQEPQHPQPVIYYEKEPRPVYMKSPEQSFLEAQGLLKNMQQQQQHFINEQDRIDNEDADDESSWYDLSEVSRTTATISKMESGDSARSLIAECPESNTASQDKIHERCETKIMDLMDLITELRRQNTSLNTKAEIVIQSLSDEINLLKSKVQKFSEVKTTLKKRQLEVPSQWQSTIDVLNKKLYNAQEENTTLKDEISNLKKKLEEFSAQKQVDNVSTRQRLAELYNKEIEMLKQNYVRHIIDLENKFTRILTEKENVFNKKLSDLKEIYDRKTADISKGTS